MNDFTQVISPLLAQGLLALRAAVVMPRLVNRDFEARAAEQGDTVDVTIASAIQANDVVPGPTSQDATDLVPTKVPVKLSNWKEAAFTLSDRERKEVFEGSMPQAASEAVKALAEAVNASVLAEYIRIYNIVGTPGTTPFGGATPSINDALEVRRVLNEERVPVADRRLVLDPVSETAALKIQGLQDASFRGDTAGIVRGQIGEKVGFQWVMDQQVPTHAKGTLSGTTGAGKALVNGAVAAGAKTMNVDDVSLTGTIVPGDVFTVAGVAGTFVVTNEAALTAAANAITGITFAPAAPAGGFADGAEVTLKGSHVVNLGFHRDAFALASRPLANGEASNGQSLTDPVSGLVLRLEVSREHKRTRWSYDILWGTRCVRPELAVRLAG